MKQSIENHGIEATDYEIIGKDYPVQFFLSSVVIATVILSLFFRESISLNWRITLWVLSVVIIYHQSMNRLFYYYRISEFGLTEYLFNKKIRDIPWDQVIQISVQKDSRGAASYPGVIVSLYGSMKYPESRWQGAMRYYRKWRPRALYIADARKNTPIIAKYYKKPIRGYRSSQSD